MAFDISVMNVNSDGVLDYRFSSLGGKITGKQKLAEHYLKALYDDEIGGLIKMIRTAGRWGESEIRYAVYEASRKIKSRQLGMSLHPDERLSRVSIKRLYLDKANSSRMDLEIVITSESGANNTITI